MSLNKDLKTHYIQVFLPTTGPQGEIALALLNAEGYEAFEETETGLLAYIPETDFSQKNLEVLLTQLELSFDTIKIEKMPPHNWNKSWEDNYQPVEIGSFCQIIASFKSESSDFEHVIRIDPKMSFGTGHHETTRLMLRQMEKLDFSDQQVLDMGCGTGVLGILASKMGADFVLGIDIDVWSQENATENQNLNGVNNMEIRLGDVSIIPDVTYDVILANINRNVLLQDVAAYSKHLSTGGILLSSGYYRQDAPLIEQTFVKAGLILKETLEENSWLSQTYVKQ